MIRAAPSKDVRWGGDKYEQRHCSKQRPPVGKPIPPSLTVFGSRQFKRKKLIIICRTLRLMPIAHLNC